MKIHIKDSELKTSTQEERDIFYKKWKIQHRDWLDKHFKLFSIKNSGDFESFFLDIYRDCEGEYLIKRGYK